MKKISVLLASSIMFRNSGMRAVDEAAYSFIKETYPLSSVTFFVPNLSDEIYYADDCVVPYDTYKVVEFGDISTLYESDLILMWGDFYHGLHYVNDFLEKYVFNDITREIELELFYKMFLLKDAPIHVYEKTIIFGNSLVHYSDEKNNFHDEIAIKLYKNAKVVMPREPTSVEIAKDILGAKFNTNLSEGCDSAFFVNSENLKKENKIGLFIGKRSKIKLKYIFSIIVFAKSNGLEIEWINWMVNRESLIIRSILHPDQMKNLFLHFLLSIIFNKGKDKNDNDIYTLSRFDIIITDTYHLAICTLRSNTKVFCISDGNSTYKNQPKEINCEKKDILFKRIFGGRFIGKPTIVNLFDVILNQINFNDTLYYRRVSEIKKRLKESCKSITGE